MEEENNQSSIKTDKPIQINQNAFFDGHDAKSSYLFFLNQVPSDVIQEYYKLKQLIKHGKTLLCCIKTNNSVDDTRIQNIMKDASNVLKSETIKKRDIRYEDINIGGERVVIYKMKAPDANECQVVTEKLAEMQIDFEKQQYSQHIGNLEEIQEQIHTELIIAGIIPAIDDTVDYMIDKIIKMNFEKMFKKDDKKDDGGAV